MSGERREEVFTTSFALTHEVKARGAPNLENRKWLNLQGKIDRKSEVSKLSDVENVEIVEAVEGGRSDSEWLRGKGSHSFRDAEIPTVTRWNH